MSDAEHTKGPWTAERQDEDSGDIYWAVHAAGDYQFITNVHTSKDDARLIAACPELLEVLTEVRETCLFADDDGGIGVTDEPTIDGDLFNRICAAITKAKGAP